MMGLDGYGKAAAIGAAAVVLVGGAVAIWYLNGTVNDQRDTIADLRHINKANTATIQAMRSSEMARVAAEKSDQDRVDKIDRDSEDRRKGIANAPAPEMSCPGVGPALRGLIDRVRRDEARNRVQGDPPPPAGAVHADGAAPPGSGLDGPSRR